MSFVRPSNDNFVRFQIWYIEQYREDSDSIGDVRVNSHHKFFRHELLRKLFIAL